MKYFKIIVGNKLIAISDDNCLIAAYMCQRKLKLFSVDKISKHKVFEFEDFMLLEFKGFVMTKLDIEIFNKMKKESSSIYNDGIKLINELIRSNNICKKDKKVLNEAVDIIKDSGKKNILGNNKTDVDLIYTVINMTEDEKEFALRNY